jgi:hypothetical protein
MVRNDDTAIGAAAPSGQRPLGTSAGIVIFGVDKEREERQAAAAGGGAGLSVNAYLWRAALDTLSFMPLASADPFGGTIITDWYSPPAAGASASAPRPTSWAASSVRTACACRSSGKRWSAGSGRTARFPPRPIPRWKTRSWRARASCAANPRPADPDTAVPAREASFARPRRQRRHRLAHSSDWNSSSPTQGPKRTLILPY